MLGQFRRGWGGGLACASAFTVFGSSSRACFSLGEGGTAAAGAAPTAGMGLSPLMGLSAVLVFLEPPWVLGGFLAVLRFGAGLAAGAASAAAALRARERSSGILAVL